MTTDSRTSDSTDIGHVIAKQYHYIRQPVASNKVLYTIPGGVHYEAIEPNTGMVYPWSLLELFDSLYADGNFLELNKLFQYNYEYIVTLSLNVEKTFHDIDAPKFPLQILCELAYIGNSSFRTIRYMKHPSRKDLFATCSVQSVLVSKETGKPYLIPDWWKWRHGGAHCNGVPLKLELPVRPAHVTVASSFPFTVFNSHCDWNKHMHFTSYIMLCYNSYVKGVNDQKYKNVTRQSLDAGIKSIDIAFKQEASRGDILTVESWEFEGQQNCLNFEIKRENTTCCQTMIEFFE